MILMRHHGVPQWPCTKRALLGKECMESPPPTPRPRSERRQRAATTASRVAAVLPLELVSMILVNVADAKRHDDDGRPRVDDSPLPFFVDPDRGVPSTRADALAARVPGAFGFLTFFAANANASQRRTHVLDVRFPHEFRGGHIRGSGNVWDPVEMHRHRLRLLASSREASHHQARTNESFVFVCDAVGDRA